MGGQFFGGSGSSGGGTPGDAPGGAAGGDLSGTYPNPGVANLNGVAAASYALLAGPTFTGTVTLPASTVTSGMILDGTIVSGDLNAAAGITSGQLAGSIAPSKVTGTAVTAADTGTVTSTMLLDGTILDADVNASAAIAKTKISGTAITAADTGTVTSTMILDGTVTGTDIASAVALAGAPTTTTPGASDSTTKIQTTAGVDATITSGLGCMLFGPNTYGAPISPFANAATTAVTNSAVNAARTLRIVVPQTGHLRDLYVFIVLQSGNMKLCIYDTGQANSGDHTVRTLLSNSGAIDVSAATSTWKGYDPNLSVTKGDTLELAWITDNTTVSVGGLAVFNLAMSTLPNTSFFPSSGAGTATNKMIAAPTSMYTTPPSTITDANWTTTNAGKVPFFIFRIS